MNTENFGKTFLNKIMSNKQVLNYAVLESINGLRSAFVGHIHFIQCQHTRTISRNENMGQSLFKNYSKFQKFDEML